MSNEGTKRTGSLWKSLDGDAVHGVVDDSHDVDDLADGLVLK